MSWWADLYDDALADVLLERTDVEHTLAFLRRVLCLEPGDRVLDQCCGIGSLAIPLARQGFEVVGVDQAARYIERATAAAGDASAKFFVGDAFTWRPDRMCNAAFNWWTSFGYAARDVDNLQMLKRAAQAIVPGGRFALDFMNIPQVLRGFRPTVTIERAGLELTRETTLDLAAGTMHKVWRYADRPDRTSALRMYMPSQLVEMLRAAGFDDIELYGDETGEPLTIDSPRCIAVAVRLA
jgi:SAM-dependent methyltransferase